MGHLLVLSDERRQVLFDEAGARLGLSAGSVEKDLWVCWILRALFALPASGPHLTFKGGTSLSKGWRLIHPPAPSSIEARSSGESAQPPTLRVTAV